MPALKNKMRKISIPMMTRVIAIQPKTLNKEKRTVDAVWTTGATVFRRGFFDDFFEELGLEKKNVRMGRLESGSAPVLDNHGFTDKRGVRAQIGVVDSASLIPNKKGLATLRFSKRPEVEEIFQDIEDGIIRNVSVGYNTFKFEKVSEANGVPTFRATDWEPVEISMVPAGADPDAKVRSSDQKMTECIFVESQKETPEAGSVEEIRNALDNKKTDESENEKVAKTENPEQTRNIGETNMPAPTPEELKAIEEKNKKIANDAREAEKVRHAGIRSVVSKTGFDSKLANEYIESDKSVDEVRTLVIDALAKKDADEKTNTKSANISIGEDLSKNGRVEGMTSALLHRFRPHQEELIHNGRTIIMPGYKLTDSGRDYAYLSLADMARECLRANGVRVGSMPKHTIVDMALNNVRAGHSTSDFPEILANVINKTLRSGYLSAPKTWMPFTSEVFVSDFKEISRTNLGDAAKLEKLEEGSEVKHGTISETAEKYRVEEYAKIVALTRKVIVNDDLNAMTKLPERMGRRAADLESDLLWDIIKANANLSDGNALFSAAHGNLSGTPAAPAQVGLSEGRKLMRRQLGLDGAEIAISPVWMFVPPEHETAAEKLIASIVPDQSTNISPFSAAGRTPLRLDVEPRLETGADGSVNPWYLTADKGQVDMLEIARLEGTNGPQTQTRDGFDVAGIEIKITHDVGVKAIDHRGLFKNAGA